MASIAPSVDLGPVVGRRTRIATWLTMPLAFVGFVIGLALLGALDDPRPFRAVLVVIATFATLDHFRNLRDRSRLVHDEVEVATRLAETKAHMHDLVERLPAAIYRDRYRRADGAFVAVDYVSPQMETLTGYPAGAFTGDPELWTRLVHPDDRDRSSSSSATLRSTIR